MEQQQFKVSFSLGTKLLLSIVSLLFLVIVFLNVSTIFLLKEDKRAYIYEAQSTGAVLAGREFVNTSRHALDTLRLFLGAADPLKPLSEHDHAVLKAAIDNQSEVIASSIYLVDSQSGKLTLVTRSAKDEELKKLKLDPADLDINESAFNPLLPELKHSSYAFLNHSKLGGTPVLAVLFADTKLASNPTGMPVAVGLVSFKDFAEQLHGLNLTIATKSGSVLFDSDPAVLYAQKSISDDALYQVAAKSVIAAGAQEFDRQGVHYLGNYFHPGFDLTVLSTTEWQKAMKATYTFIEKCIYLGLMAIGAAVIFAILFSKTLIAPLRRLYEGTKEVAAGNFNLEIAEASRDEIGALTGSFNVMSRKIKDLIQESVDKAHLENELQIASTVQQTLIPPAKFINQLIQIRSHYQPASQCGGDWWGFFGVRKKLTLMIADATGHGLPSALITASARSCFSVINKLAQEDTDFSFSPSAMLSYANRVIYDASLGKIMMTFFIGVIDFETGTFTYSNAGHNPPWLFSRVDDGYRLKSIVATGQRLGEMKDAPEFEERSVQISPNDILFLYTDGLMEGKNVEGDQYGKKRTRKIVESNLSGGLEKLITSVMADFMQHNEGKALDDDVTIAAAMIMPPLGD